MLLSYIFESLAAITTWRPGTTSTPTSNGLQPSVEIARERAYPIFRSLNSAGRQWGSSVSHNGFGFFPAIIPAGTVLYHGARTENRPATFEWLAFEAEHAETFALDSAFCPGPKEKRGEKSQKMLAAEKTPTVHDESCPGYLHTYATTRDLHVLYLDGMSAAKSNLGTMDQELYVIFGKKNENFEAGEWARAEVNCKMLKDWGYDGYIRMEIGFEYIHCDFSEGLDTVSVVPAYGHQGLLGDLSMLMFQWLRAASESYDGVGADRLKIDYSSMVSGLFYPLNITATDPERPDLVRLAAAGMENTLKLRADLERIAKEPRRFTVDWQAVTDRIVHRFENRLGFLASKDISKEYFIGELETASRTYMGAPEQRDSRAPLTPEMLETSIKRCVDLPLISTRPSSQRFSREDKLIEAAIRAVTEDICTTLLESYSAVRAAAEKDDRKTSDSDEKPSTYFLDLAVETAQKDIRNLTKGLDWSVWKKVRPCALGEMLLTVMWPWGNTEDYFHPSCQNIKDIYDGRDSYWIGTFPGGVMSHDS